MAPDEPADGAETVFRSRLCCGDDLRRMLDLELFPELWRVRTVL